MKLSSAYIPTQKEIPADAVIPSHQLMLRAGLIRLLAAGIYTYLPLGWKVMQKVIQIIQEEMNRIGAQELYMPVLNPIEIWDETGRNEGFGEEMFRLKDRKDRTMSLAPTHEEIICDLARKFIRSYKDMPQIWYQIQTKFRDEPRPRSGVVRARQFFMKDAYSLDSDIDGLNNSYELHADAYKAIFKRCGLVFHIVGASSGLMGGSASQEFMLESEHGEDSLVLCNSCDYAANLEIARSKTKPVEKNKVEVQKVHTPGQKTIEEVAQFLKKKPFELMKSLVFISNEDPLMVLVRGDHDVNESKLTSITGAVVRPAHAEEVLEICGAETGFVGPVGLKKNIKIIADEAIKNQHDLTTGANEKDYHLTGLEIGRDFNVEAFYDLRTVLGNEKCIQCDGDLRTVNAIELGHIFKLGTKYSDAMKATFLDKNGKEKPIIMGSYGIGVERIIAASIEQSHDDKGIVWNTALAPYLIHLIPINYEDPAISDLSDELYKFFMKKGIDILMDDRKASPGFKFKDADLLGMPIQIIVGKKWIQDKKIEIKNRKSGKTVDVKLDEIENTVNEIFNGLKADFN